MARNFAVSLLMLLAVACNIPPDAGKKLGVPFRAQEQFNYCAATNIQMWRLYHGLPSVSQQSIFNWMGSFPGACGSNQLGVQAALRHFTNAFDATWITMSNNIGVYDKMAAQQITSIDSGEPVAVVIDFDHVVLINGGLWEEFNGSNRWNFVYVHNPAFSFGNTKYVASDWLDAFCPGFYPFCEHFASLNAIEGWNVNLSAFGSTVTVYGTAPGSGPFDQN
jgi:hypothetical protein